MKENTVDQILDADLVKRIVDKYADCVGDINTILIITRHKDDKIHYTSNCHRSESLGMCDIVHDMILHKGV